MYYDRQHLWTQVTRHHILVCFIHSPDIDKEAVKFSSH